MRYWFDRICTASDDHVLAASRAFELKAFREPHGMEDGTVNASTPVIEEEIANVGAGIMGRGKFGSCSLSPPSPSGFSSL